MHGAIILIAANIIVKIIGALFRIPMTNIIGGEGMGYFQTAYGMYNMLFVLSTAGLPVAVSKLVSENVAKGNYSDVKKIFNISLVSFMIIGLIGTFVMFAGAQSFAQLANNDKAVYCVIAIAPAIFFVAIVCTFRGYFQGLSNMVPTAVSQIIEALSKLFIGFIAALLLLKLGESLEIASSGAILGTTIGSVLAAIVLIVFYKRSKQIKFINEKAKNSKSSRSSMSIFKEIIKIAIPITIGASVLSLTNLVDLFLVMNRLGDAGFTQAQANSLYGTYTSMAVTLFNLPPSIVISLSISIIPAIAGAFALNNIKRLKNTIESALRIGVLFALPCAVGIAVLSKPILDLLFFSRPSDVAIAAPLLTSLGGGVFFVCMVSLTSSMLQAIGKVNIPVITMLIGGCIKLATNYILVGNPSINIAGAPIGTTLCYGMITVLNTYFLIKTLNIVPNFLNVLIKPLVSSVAMGISAIVVYNFSIHIVGSKISTLVSVIIAMVIYILMLIVVKGFVKQDIELMPRGKKLAAFMEKRGWLLDIKENNND